MADSLAPRTNIPCSPRRSPSRSPHKHVLRPRRSYQRLPPSHLHPHPDSGKLRSPLRLEDGKVAPKGRGRGGTLLFPASASADTDGHPPPAQPVPPSPPPPPAPAPAPAPVVPVVTKKPSLQRMRDPLKKLATSLSGAVSGKGKAARAKQGFDLSDWNYDLAAIASDPSSSSTSPAAPPPSAPNGLPLPRISTAWTGASNELVTPIAFTFPTAYSVAPNRSVSQRDMPNETRRRKSEEMGDDERPAFQAAAPPVRRDGGHARSHSLAHAHTLRSSRTLSQHFAPPDANSASLLRNNLSVPLLSSQPATSGAFAPTPQPAYHHHPYSHSTGQPPAGSPFHASKTRGPLNESIYRDPSPSPSTTALRPSKKISVEGLFSIADRSDEDENDDAFGGGTISSRRGHRTKSLTRPSNAHFTAALPTSSSHPGWTGDGLDTASATRKHVVTRSPELSIRTRSRASSTVSTLGTLSESGPAVESFPFLPSGDTQMEFNPMFASASLNDLPFEVSTPPRRRSEPCFSLFGGSLPVASGSAAPVARRIKKSAMGMGDGPRGASMPDMSMRNADDDDDGDTEADPSSFAFPGGSYSPIRPSNRRFSLLPTPAQTSSLPSRRAASHDSLLSVSYQSPHTAARKRNANGALLLGPGASTGGSKLAAASPVVAQNAAPWYARESTGEFTKEYDDSAEDEDMWNRSMSPGPPQLTDGTTSASSSPSTSLSSHADADPVDVRSASPSVSIISQLSASASQAQFTPQNYKNVRPLQAAFMSAGLVSKRARARDSGVGMSPFVGGKDPTNELANSTSSSSSLAQSESSFEAPPKPPSTLALASVLRSAQVMPDTPVKRLAFSQKTSSTALSLDDPSPPATTATDTEEETDDVFPLPAPPPALVHPDVAMRWSPRHPPLSPLSMDEGPSDSTSGSSSSSRTADAVEYRPGDPQEVSPTNTLSARVKGGRAPGWRRPTLFRRRSSGQLSNEGSGAFLSVSGGPFRSGSSSGSSSQRSMVIDGEPMTPTRSVGAGWSDATQLVDTPTDSPLVTPATPAFPPLFAHHYHNPSLATPSAYGRQSFPFTDMERRQGRPALPRHQSGSVVLSLRQQEFQQVNVFEQNYTLLRSIGNGAFSDAFEVYDKPRDSVFAVKRTKHPFSGAKDRLRRLEEVDILRFMSEDPDPHLISLVDAWEQTGHLFIQTELCEGGNLAVFLEEYGRTHETLDEARVWKILTEVALGVQHLHARNVIHLDLKPANVFIAKDGHLKIGDFGLSTRWPRTDPISIVRGANVPSPQWERESWRTEPGERRVRAKSNGDVPEELEREGDREYIAPEILGGRYGKEADVFSLGLIILEAAANVILPDNGPAWHKLRSNDFSDVDLSRLSSPLVELLTGMLDKSPDRRLTIDDVLAQPTVARLAALPAIQGAVVEEDTEFLYRACPELYARSEQQRHERAGSEVHMDID